MNNVSVIDTFLNTFTTYIDSGFGLVRGDVAYLSSTLIVIDITLAGLFWAWGADEDILQRLVKKTLYVGFFAFIIANFNSLSAIVFNSFAGLGLKAGGSSIWTDGQFLRPAVWPQVGLDAGQPLLDAVGQLMGFSSFFANFVQIAVLMMSWLLVLIAFFILAVQLFVTLIEFKLTTLAGFVLIPFALFNKTAFLAEKVLGNIVASGVKVMVLAVIVGIGTGLFSQFTTSFARRPADDRAGALRRPRGARHAGPRHLRPRHRHRPRLRRAAARRGRGRRHRPRRRRRGHGGRRAAGPGRKGRDGGRLRRGSRGAGRRRLWPAARHGLWPRVGRQVRRGRRRRRGSAGSGAPRRPAAAPMRRKRRHGASVKDRFAGGARAAFAATGGTSTAGTVGGEGEPAAPDASDAGDGAPPAWAQRLKRHQTVIHGAQPPPRPCSPAKAMAAAIPSISRKENSHVGVPPASVRYGRTPEPETPYQRAAQAWDERIGSARVQARNWRLMAFGSLGALGRSWPAA